MVRLSGVRIKPIANEMKQKYRMRTLGGGRGQSSKRTHLRGRISPLDRYHLRLLVLLLLLLLLELLLLLLGLLGSRWNLLGVALRRQAVGGWSVPGGSVVGSWLAHLCLLLLLLLLGLWSRWGAEGIPFG